MSFNKSDEIENGFTFIWKIKNFSLCSTTEELVSPSFLIERLHKTKWDLRLFTNFNEKDVILNLHRHENDDGPFSKIPVDVKLFLLNRKGCKEKTHFKPNRTYGKNFRLIEPLKIARDFIFLKAEHFIPDDILTVGCHLTNNSEDMCCKVVCSGSTEITAEKFLYSIPVAFQTSDIPLTQMITIPLTSSSKKYHDFKLELQLHVFSTIPKKVISKVIIGRFSVPIVALCEMELREANGIVKYKFKGECCFQVNEINHAWQLSCLETMNDWKVWRCPNMNVFIKFSLSEGTTLSSFENVYCSSTLEVDDKKCLSKHPAEEKLKSLLVDKKFCDFVFCVDGKDFPVHKAILSATSPVFYAMFDHDMREKTNSAMIIEDVEADIMEKLIEFIYTDAVEDLSLENAVKLYSAADKYQILLLKRKCAELISSDLTIDNVSDVLSIADIYQDEFLKNTADSFIFLNSKEIFRSKKWKEFMEKNVSVAAKSMHEICIRMTENL